MTFPPDELFKVAFQVILAVPLPTAKSSPAALVMLLVFVAENVPFTPLPTPSMTPLSVLLVLVTTAFWRSMVMPLIKTPAPPVAVNMAPELAVSPAVAAPEPVASMPRPLSAKTFRVVNGRVPEVFTNTNPDAPTPLPAPEAPMLSVPAASAWFPPVTGSESKTTLLKTTPLFEVVPLTWLLAKDVTVKVVPVTRTMLTPLPPELLIPVLLLNATLQKPPLF